MLSALRLQVALRLRHERGFTLVELVVAMAAGIIVMFAATSIMTVTMHQTQRTFTKVDATRQARTALATLENELHSACVNGTAPIQGVTTAGTVESDDNDLVFVSYYGTSASPQPVWHQVSYSASAHTLVDTTYGATYVSTSSGGYWSPTGSGTSTRLLSNVTVLPGASAPFQYYAYAQYPASSGNLVYWTIPDGSNPNPLTGATLTSAPLSTSGGLSASLAATVVEVTVNLLVGPTSENLNNLSATSLTTFGDPVTDSISLRLTTPPDYAPAGTGAAAYGPCR